MDGEGLTELFAPFAAVAVKRMFGGHGVYLDGLCFAIEADGEVYREGGRGQPSAFVAAGSSPFVYVAKGRPTTMAYWRLVASAYDDEEELKRWAALGVGAARRAAAIKASKADKTAGATGRGARGKKTTR